MELIHAINEWAAAIGMRQVESDETGGFTLLFDGAHEVSFAPDGDGTVFHAEVGDVERLDREGALSLLEASLLGAGTGGAAFGVHRELGAVVLWKRFGEFSSRADLETAIGEFLGQVVVRKEKLSVGGPSAPDSPSGSSVLGGSFLQV